MSVLAFVYPLTNVNRGEFPWISVYLTVIWKIGSRGLMCFVSCNSFIYNLDILIYITVINIYECVLLSRFEREQWVRVREK